MGFALDDSNFAMQSAFTVFMGTAIGWFTGGAITLSRGLGYVDVPYTNAKVTGVDGRPVTAVSVPGATIFDAARPGVFTVVSDAGTTRVVANVIDPQVADVNRSRFAGSSVAVAPTLHFARLRFEPWIVLLALAVALLAFEWMAYTRRGTI